MVSRSKVTSAPLTEVVTLQNLKDHLRITHTSEDTRLSFLIIAAREAAEEFTGRKFIDQELTMYIDAPVCREPWFSGTQQGARNALGGNSYVPLEWLPAASITSVSSFDYDNTETVFSSSNYFLDNADNDMPGRVVLNYGSVWPSNLRDVNALKFVYRVGYGTDATDVPAPIREGVLRLASWLYANPGDCDDPSACMFDCGAAAPLGKYRVMTV